MGTEEELQQQESPPAQEAEPVEPAEPNRISVDLSEDADDEPSTPSAVTPERIRHKSEWRKLKERYESDVSELRRELSELKGRVSAPRPEPQPAQRQQTTDPLEGEIRSISRQQDFILRAVRYGEMSAQEAQDAQEEWRNLDRKRRALEYKVDNPQANQPQQSSVQSEDQMIGQLVRIEFPHIFEDAELLHRAEAEMLGLMKRGRAKSLATAREACNRVAKRTGLFNTPPPPTAGEKARYSGVPARAGANGTGGQQFVPTKQQLQLALAWSSHLDHLSDSERVKLWAQKVGKPAGLI